MTIEETIVKTRNVVEEIRWESAIATEDGIPTTKKFTTETEREIARGGIETGRDPAAAPEAENAPVSDVADPDQGTFPHFQTLTIFNINNNIRNNIIQSNYVLNSS